MWSVLHGDAFQLAQREPEETIDLVLTSPPYWGLRTYGLEHDDHVLATWQAEADDPLSPPGYEWYRSAGGQLGCEPYPEWFIGHLVEILDALAPAIRGRGSLWVNLGDTYFARWSSVRDDGRQGINGAGRRRRKTPSGQWRTDKQLLMIPARFAIAMQESGWVLRNDLIWWKENVAPRPERDRLRLSHEHFFHFVRRPRRGRPAYYYDLEGAESGGYDVVRAPSGQRIESQTATFPDEIVRPRIRSSSPPGGLVLDPFCGSGTALAIALSEGRQARGFDLSLESVQLARRRARGSVRRALQRAA